MEEPRRRQRLPPWRLIMTPANPACCSPGKRLPCPGRRPASLDATCGVGRGPPAAATLPAPAAPAAVPSPATAASVAFPHPDTLLYSSRD